MSAARLTAVCMAVFLAAGSSPIRADGPIRKPSFDPQAERVELFEGVEREQLSVRVSARDAFQSSVFITNVTDQPLTVALPEGVVAVHVLKQFAPPGGVIGANNGFGFGNNAQQGQGQGQGAAQSVGGNMFGLGQGNNVGANAIGNQFPGGLFSIPPEKTVQVGLATACLDHGRPEPLPRMTYVLRRVEDHTDDPVLQELIRGFDPERDDRLAFQAAVWHRSSELGWPELAAKTNKRGPLRIRYFTDGQIDKAKALVSAAEELAQNRTAPPAQVARTERRR